MTAETPPVKRHGWAEVQIIGGAKGRIGSIIVDGHDVTDVVQSVSFSASAASSTGGWVPLVRLDVVSDVHIEGFVEVDLVPVGAPDDEAAFRQLADRVHDRVSGRLQTRLDMWSLRQIPWWRRIYMRFQRRAWKMP